MLKAIVIASFSVPILVFTLFVVTGFIFLASDLSSEKYSNGWAGLVYAGATYGYFSVLISTIPTIVLGFPAALIASKYGWLKKRYILAGAVSLGGLFLGAASTVLFKEMTMQSVFWFLLAGSVGGLINGYVFWKLIKPQ